MRSSDFLKPDGVGQTAYKGPIKYMGQDIAQWHNPKIFINEMLHENRFKQFTSILLIGSQGSGKSTLRRFIAHQVHTKDDFYICNFEKKHMEILDELLETLPRNRNLMLNFEDVSLVFKTMKDSRKKNQILQCITEARHPKLDGPDRRIIVCSEVHYGPAMEKMMRSLGSWRFWTDMSTEELGIFDHMTKGRWANKAAIFSKLAIGQFRKGKFEVSLTQNRTKEYLTNDPFRFVMCFDTIQCRFFLVPEENCGLCAGKHAGLPQVRATPAEIVALAQKYYAKDGLAGLKLALAAAGHTGQYRNNVAYAYTTASEILKKFDVDKEALALHLRKNAQIDGEPRKQRRTKTKAFLADLDALRATDTPKADQAVT